METDRLITVAIHTYERAVRLKQLLEREGVNATLQNVNLAAPVMSAGVRVRIAESDLSLALRIIENPEIFAVESDDIASRQAHTILVPVDFTEKSLNAARLAFSIAARSGAKVVLLHSFLVPHSNPLMSMGDTLTFDNTDAEVEDVEVSVVIARQARQQMLQLEQQLRDEIKRGELPAVKSSTALLEGVPEECIGQYVKEHREVRLLIMGSRRSEKKALDMAGSITAEVLDSCRIQALTVPECGHGSKPVMRSLESVERIALLSHLEQEDFLAFDAVNRLMPADKPLAVKVICMPNVKYSKPTNDAARRALQEYCAEHFPHYEFSLVEHDKSKADLDVAEMDLVVVPSRKKNIFARLFNPGAAHRLLFHADVPLLVIPV